MAIPGVHVCFFLRDGRWLEIYTLIPHERMYLPKFSFRIQPVGISFNASGNIRIEDTQFHFRRHKIKRQILYIEESATQKEIQNIYALY